MTRGFGRFMALKKPCADCPFVVAHEFPLHASRRQEIAQSLRVGESFPCHKTVTYDDDGQVVRNRGESRCFGAASVLHKSGEAPMQLEQIAYRLGVADYNPDALDREDTFSTLEEFEEGPDR